MSDFISDVIERSRLRFNPRLAYVCLELIRLSEKDPPPDKRCWRLMQTLFMIEKARPMNLPYYWYKEGIVVDPASLTQQTGGIVMFRWDEQCPGCQIEEECPCEGNPQNRRAK
jgi:hypothetical protein